MYKKTSIFLFFIAFAFLTACSSGPDEGKIIGFDAAEDTEVDAYFLDKDTYIEMGERYLEVANDFIRVMTYMAEEEVGPVDVLEEYLTDDEIEAFTEDLDSVDKSWEKYKKAQIIVAQEQLAFKQKGREAFLTMKTENADKRKTLKQTAAELKKSVMDNDNLRKSSITQINNVIIKHNKQYKVASDRNIKRNYTLGFDSFSTVTKPSLTKEECNSNTYFNAYLESSAQGGRKPESQQGFPVFVDGICYKVFDSNGKYPAVVPLYLWGVKHYKTYPKFDEIHKKQILDQVIPIVENYVKNVFLAKIDIKPAENENKKAQKKLTSLDYEIENQMRRGGYSEYDLRNAEEKVTLIKNEKMGRRFERQNTENVQLKLLKSMEVALHKEYYDDFEGDIQHSKVDNDGVFDIPSEDFAIIVKKSPGVIKYETLDLRDKKYEGNDSLEIRERDIYSRLDKGVVEIVELEFFKNLDEFSSFPALMKIIEKAPFKIKKEDS